MSLKTRFIHLINTPTDQLSGSDWLLKNKLTKFTKYFWAIAITSFILLAYSINVSFYVYFFYFAIVVAIISRIIEFILYHDAKKQKDNWLNFSSFLPFYLVYIHNEIPQYKEAIINAPANTFILIVSVSLFLFFKIKIHKIIIRIAGMVNKTLIVVGLIWITLFSTELVLPLYFIKNQLCMQ